MSHKFTIDTTNDELIETITEWEKTSVSYHDEMLSHQNRMVQYYQGNQTDRNEVPPYNSDSVYNRFFEAIETLIPILTGSAHQFVATPAEETDESMSRAQRVQRILNYNYDRLRVREKLELVARDMMIKRFGVLEYGWDMETNDFGLWVRDPRSILIPKYRLDPHDLPYVIKLAEFDEDDIAKFFPDVDANDLQTGIGINVSRHDNNEADENIYQIQVVYTDTLWVWRQGDTILKKIANPFFDFEEKEKVEEDPRFGKVRRTEYSQEKNYLKNPEKPLIFFTPFRVGDAPIAPTSICETAEPIQDDINVAKRQIIDNMRRMGNGQVYIDSDSMTKEEAATITSEPGLQIIGAGVASENKVRREAGVPLPNSHFSNLADSINAFDSVFGTHGALRGAGESNTLGGQILDRNQNLSRIQQLTEVLNRGVSRLANGMVQVMKMYYDSEMVIPALGAEGTTEFMTFINDDIESQMTIQTKSGVPPTIDPQARYNQAIQLWQLGALDPETLFSRLEFTDPQTTSQKLSSWRAGQTLFESQIRQQEEGARAQQAGGTERPAATSNQNNPEGRGSEDAEALISRTRQSLSDEGTAPLSNPSN